MSAQCEKCSYMMIYFDGIETCINCKNIFEKELEGAVQRLEVELTAKEMERSVLTQRVAQLEDSIIHTLLRVQERDQDENDNDRWSNGQVAFVIQMIYGVWDKDRKEELRQRLKDAGSAENLNE